MNLPAILIIGACAHALLGTGIFWAKEEPYRVQIFAATILKGMLVALLIAFTLEAGTSKSVGAGAGYGVLYGLAFGFVVFLAKGANFKTTPHILIGSILQGVLTGALIAKFVL